MNSCYLSIIYEPFDIPSVNLLVELNAPYIDFLIKLVVPYNYIINSIIYKKKKLFLFLLQKLLDHE